MPQYKETCCVNWSRSSQTFLNNRNLTKVYSIAGFSKNIEKRTFLHYTWWWSTWHSDRIMSRAYLTSEWWIIPRERVDPSKHENRSSPWGEGLLSSRTFVGGDNDRIFDLWRNWFLGSHREWNQETRNRNFRRNSCCKCWWQRYRESCREDRTTTKAD